jgi:RimJ/RimL family protein N-acetyltransferase
VIRIDALLDPWNAASRRVGNNSGFHPEGQLRLYLELNAHLSTRSRTRCCDPISDGADRT